MKKCWMIILGFALLPLLSTNVAAQQAVDSVALLPAAESLEGKAAIDFTGTDAEGRSVSLSSLKGKLVYVDVWATWCGPCKKEIPSLKELEESFADRADIVFLSISVDYPSYHQRWLNMVKEKELKGIQLFAGEGRKKLLADYQIKGIPRFMLVGKDGTLLYLKAPKPSSDAIRPLLEQLLAE